MEYMLFLLFLASYFIFGFEFTLIIILSFAATSLQGKE